MEISTTNVIFMSFLRLAGAEGLTLARRVDSLCTIFAVSLKFTGESQFLLGSQGLFQQLSTWFFSSKLDQSEMQTIQNFCLKIESYHVFRKDSGSLEGCWSLRSLSEDLRGRVLDGSRPGTIIWFPHVGDEKKMIF